MIYKADLHIHSCLSPCGSLDMSPRAIVTRAKEIGLNCLALTDHNSAGNCAAMARLCEREGILFFPGLEVTTAEEAHIVCLFGEVGAAQELGRIVYEKLPAVKFDPEKLGDQVYVNEEDEVEGFEEKYLVPSCGYSIDELRKIVAGLDGLFIAAHIDKPCFSVVSQLGFLSGEFSAVELSRAGAARESTSTLTRDYTTVTASDSHYIHTIGSAYTEFESDVFGIKGFKHALRERQTKIVVFDSAFRTAPGERAPRGG